MKIIKRILTPNRIVIFMFSLYLISGLLLVDDYGISWDEPVEHHTSVINYVHVLGIAMRASDNDTVRDIASNTPELLTWYDRVYGTALQCITVFIEHLHGFEMTSRQIYLMRHAFTFLNYSAAGIFFYLILRRRFGNTYIPVVGTLFFILYPRFFGESFYNIKDILFYSWVIIAGYFILRWLEEDDSKFLFPAALTLAVATNTRILGLSLLLLASAFAIIMKMQPNIGFKCITRKPLMLFAWTSVCYLFITPFLWNNPLINFMYTFYSFSKHRWDGVHLYRGELISSDVPWHYIIVWMGISIPLLYIIMFFIGIAAICFGLKPVIVNLKRNIAAYSKKETPNENKRLLPGLPRDLQMYDLFFAALFFCTLLGFIVLQIRLCDGWRHVYSLFFPFLYIACYGLERGFSFVLEKRTVFLRCGFACAVAAGLLFQSAWIAVNHPYQYVYFNIFGRQVAEKNFELDYYAVSHHNLIRYALDTDDRPSIIISGTNFANIDFLSEDDKARVVWVPEYESDAFSDYHLLITRAGYNDWTPSADLEEIKSIFVDGMKISALYKRIHTADFDHIV